MLTEKEIVKGELTFEEFKKEVLEDFTLANISREASLLGRKEVLTGKAKFGIFGDGKELAQIAMAKQFRNGDFRSGYYRDQTFMMAIGALTVKEYFAALYAHTDVKTEPASGGRQMGGHYATRSLHEDGSWKNLSEMKNSSADISPTAGQMPRLLGLALASKLFRNNEQLHSYSQFSNKGNEIAFGTIGDASTSEGLFWETINAAGVLQVPMLMSVWDDGYGISVPKKYQTTKESISEILKGFQRTKEAKGYEIYKVKGWDYAALCETYAKAAAVCRTDHSPVLVHVEEVTQPQGHSTSGSHERYKSKEVLQWTTDFDCIRQFRLWILNYEKQNGKVIATEEELDAIQAQAKKEVRQQQKTAWEEFLAPIRQELNEVLSLLTDLAAQSAAGAQIEELKNNLQSTLDPIRRDILGAARKALRYCIGEDSAAKQQLSAWIDESLKANFERYSSTLYSESAWSALKVEEIRPQYNDDSELVDARLILRDNFDKILAHNPLVSIFGEDAGFIGDVNQGLEGMQAKYSDLRVTDTGIREATIIGQGIGMAMRGLRPIAEIQYLDYLLYGLQIMSDDLATVQYRTKGGQKAPLIIRTRGHRLEGIWHSGSPMGTIINALRGVYVCVPRNMTQAAGFYNTLLKADDAALIIEPLNGYRKKERMPFNLGEYTVPLGVPEVVRTGNDMTIVSYGSTLSLCQEAADQLAEVGIDVELIDVQTLLPFDIHHHISASVAKTNRLLIIDEDVPGGASAYILDKILVEQKAYFHLDSDPVTLAAKEHRPAYGSDGDYFSKPSVEDIFETAYQIMHEANPGNYPSLY